MQNKIREQITESIKLKQKLLESQDVLSEVEKAAGAIIHAYRNGKKLLIAGNGGSAADAQHIAAELVNRFAFDRPALPAIALTTDSSIVTSISNDSGFDLIYARQVEALGNEGDVFVGISTSGNSANLLIAARTCRERKLTVVGFTGATGGKLQELCDICIKVPYGITPRIQEAQILIGHILCGIVEEELFPDSIKR